MAKKFDVALIVRSAAHSLNDVESILACRGSAGSHDKDEVRRDGSTWTKTIWRKDANDRAASLLGQSMQVLSEWGAKCLQLSGTNPADITVCLDIAVFYDTANCTLELPAQLVSQVAEVRIGVDISTYPSTFES